MRHIPPGEVSSTKFSRFMVAPGGIETRNTVPGS